MEKNQLKTKIEQITLSNPLMPASGPLVGDEEKILAISKFGVGGLVTKTISSSASQVPRPCIYGGKNYIMNAELWSEYDPKKWIKEFLPKVKSDSNVPLFISVGYSKEDMELLIPKLDSFADAFEISTHYVGKDLSVIAETVAAIRKKTTKPFFMKMSPHISDPVAFAKIVLDNGGNGVVAINSLGPTMTIDLNRRSVHVGNGKGEVWSSGPVIKPLALAFVHKIKRAIPECTIIGVGGIETADDVLEFLLAGADAVQMLSAAMLHGKDLYEKIVKDLPQALKKYRFSSIKEVIETRLQIEPVKLVPNYPKISQNRCILCNKCVKLCPYFALSCGEQKVMLDESQCFGCGLCQSQCPVGAITGMF